MPPDSPIAPLSPVSPEERPRVGVGVLVLRHGAVLLGERRGAHGAATWAPPGGHLEFGESAEACAARELVEETGLVMRAWQAGPWSVNEFPEIGRQYATLFVVATTTEGEPTTREPDKCLGWHWFAWNALPSPLFAPLAALVATGWTPPQLPVLSTPRSPQ